MSSGAAGRPRDGSAAVPLRVEHGPERIGRFVVLETLGRGGMGVVLAAYDEELDRHVAIKLVRGTQSRRRNERIFREARALARVSHPNVVQVYEVGIFHGQVFVAMELVRGESLERWLEVRRPWQQVLDAFVQAGSGLASAHAQGIVHRDFKPDNVIVGEDGRVRVLDFGLALRRSAVDTPELRALGDGPLDHESTLLAERLTRTGVRVGTPAYMSPEQHQDSTVGPASDQYSFCVALYEALYGARPPDSTGEPIDPKAAKPHERARRVPARIRAVLAKGLAREPSERWRSMDELLAKLGRARRARRARWALALVLVAGGIGMGSLVATPHEGTSCAQARTQQLAGTWDDDARDRLRRAVLDGDDPEPEASAERLLQGLDGYARTWGDLYEAQCEARRRGESSPEQLERSFGCLRRERLRFQQRVIALEAPLGLAWTRAIRAVPRPAELSRCTDPVALLADPGTGALDPLAAELETELFKAEATKELGSYAAAMDSVQAVRRQATDHGLVHVQAEAALLQVSLWLELNDAEAADEAAAAAVRAGESAGDDRLIARALVARAYGLGYVLARHEEGLRWADVAQAKLQRLEGGDELIEAEIDSVRGAILASRGDLVEARAAFDRAVARRQDSGSLETLEGAHLLDNLGHVALQLSRDDEAEARYRRALAVREHLLGYRHPDLARSFIALAGLHYHRGEPERAIDTLLEAVQRQEAALGPDHPEVAVTYMWLGQASMQRDDLQAARAQFGRAIEILEHGPADHPHLANARLNAAAVFRDLGRLDRARAQLQQVIDSCDPRGEHVAMARIGLGRVALADADCAQAEPLLEQGLELLRGAEAADAQIAGAQLDLASALWNDACDRGQPDPRAYALAQDAADRYARLGSLHFGDLEDARTWLAEHPLDEPAADEPR
ncbi:MAG: serine/threonine-protein kinase [Nannocystaceae bacterium]